MSTVCNNVVELNVRQLYSLARGIIYIIYSKSHNKKSRAQRSRVTLYGADTSFVRATEILSRRAEEKVIVRHVTLSSRV